MTACIAGQVRRADKWASGHGENNTRSVAPRQGSVCSKTACVCVPSGTESMSVHMCECAWVGSHTALYMQRLCPIPSCKLGKDTERVFLWGDRVLSVKRHVELRGLVSWWGLEKPTWTWKTFKKKKVGHSTAFSWGSDIIYNQYSSDLCLLEQQTVNKSLLIWLFWEPRET